MGRGVTEVLEQKDYGQIYLVDTRLSDEQHSSKVIKIACGDLSKEENVASVFEKISFDENSEYFAFSTIGGYFGGKEIADLDYADWNRIINLNLNIAFLIGKYFSKNVRNTKGGSICFTSAISGNFPEVQKSVYGTSKNALNFMVKSLAIEGEKLKFSANAIAPFILETEENKEWVEDKRDMVSPKKIGELVNNLFDNYKIISGNVIELPGTVNIE